MQGELVDLGFEVSLVADESTAPPSSGTDLVVLAASTGQSVLGSRYRDVAVPVVAMGYGAWSPLGMTSGPGYSTTETSELLVIDSNHPIATDLPTTFAPANSTTLIKAVPEEYVPASANPVAVRAGVTTAHAVYTMSTGDVRADGTVTPASRVVLGLTDGTLADLSDDGVRLVDNAIQWASDAGEAWLVTTGLTPVGRWKLDSPVTIGGVAYFPNSYANHAVVKGKRFANTTVTLQNGSLTMTGQGTKFLNFPGFRDMAYPSGWDPDDHPGCTRSVVTEACGAKVSPTESALVLASTGANPSQDMNVYRPGPGVKKFQVKVSIKPVEFKSSESGILASQSPNVIQMGRTEDPGQWKVSVEADMRPRCEFTGNAGGSLGKRTITAMQDKNSDSWRLKENWRYTLTCTLVRQSPSTIVNLLINSKDDLGLNGKVISASASYQTFTVSPTARQIWVGHKPPLTDGGGCDGCDAPGDSFAGGIDDIWISRQD